MQNSQYFLIIRREFIFLLEYCEYLRTTNLRTTIDKKICPSRSAR